MRLLCLVLVAGCYSPQYAPGGTCTTTCPGDLECLDGTCVVAGTLPGDAQVNMMVDAAKLTIDAAIDARPIDAPPPDLTLIAHWKLDDDPSDGSISDSTGNNHNGSCTGTQCPTLVTGVKGGGYRYDPAMNQRVVVPDSNAFRGNFTICGWMYTDNTNQQIAVMSKPFGTGTGNSWQLENLDDDKVSFSGGSVHMLESPNAVPQMTWTHIAGTWDGTTKRLYINGVLAASVTSNISYDTSPIFLGADRNNGSIALPFDGVLDDLRIYNRVLPASELQMLAQP
jgi:hypothetical protein